MPLKIVIAESNGKSWKLELSEEALAGKNIGDTIGGNELKPEFAGYELQITGGSDIAGFPMSKDTEGIGLKRVLLARGFAMRDNYPGIRRKKTVRGKQIAQTTAQLNMKVIKAGAKKFEEIFPEQNKPKEKKKKEAAPKAAETAPVAEEQKTTAEKKAEVVGEEKKEAAVQAAAA